MAETTHRPARRALIAAVVFAAALTSAPAAAAAPDWATLKQRIRSRFPEVAHVGVDELRRSLEGAEDARPVLLDARSAAEFDVSHLQGARLARDADEAMRVLAGVPASRPVAIYCSVGYRSAALARELARRGRAQVVNVEGSLFEWANRGWPVHRGNAVVTVVHPFDADWGQLLDRRLWSTQRP